MAVVGIPEGGSGTQGPPASGCGVSWHKACLASDGHFSESLFVPSDRRASMLPRLLSCSYTIHYCIH
jgi:hypothetical protein